jgi:hypothetical protein
MQAEYGTCIETLAKKKDHIEETHSLLILTNLVFSHCCLDVAERSEVEHTTENDG